MTNTLEYKGYIGSVEYSQDDRVFFGKILMVDDLVTFESDRAEELEEVFQERVDDYLLSRKELEILNNNNHKRTGKFIGMLDGKIGNEDRKSMESDQFEVDVLSVDEFKQESVSTDYAEDLEIAKIIQERRKTHKEEYIPFEEVLKKSNANLNEKQ